MPLVLLVDHAPGRPGAAVASRGWSALTGADEVLRGFGPSTRLAAALDAAGLVLRVRRGRAGRADQAPESRCCAGAEAATVVWLLGPDGDAGLTDALAVRLVEAGDDAAGSEPPEVELVAGSWDLPGARLLDLVAVMDRLRSPGGCPWDAAQTHRSLLQYLLEEAYETVEAIETDDLDALREELGDLLLQVVFHARLGEEHAERPWSVDDVAAGIVDKLVARHPHVFAPSDGPAAATAEQVEARWDELKTRREGPRRPSSTAYRWPSRRSRWPPSCWAGPSGPAWPCPYRPSGHRTHRTACRTGRPRTRSARSLLALVARASAAGVDAEAALRGAARAYAERVRAAEQEAAARQR